ncbi:MAG: cobalamin B12-binding domain-containing protein [Candidatus Cyclobacteriaceae bacterium M3_2C_046]
MNLDQNREELYQIYKEHLLKGNKQACSEIVNTLIEQQTDVMTIFLDYFQRSLYEIGLLWENNKISVAVEHLATSITSSLMNLLYPFLFATDKNGKKAVVSCIANEYHQIGGKMVADTFELNGWKSFYLGANTPLKDLKKFIAEKDPEVIALSVAIFSNTPKLVQTIEAIRKDFPDKLIMVGGQAFKWGGLNILADFEKVKYIDSLPNLENFLKDSQYA